MSSFDIASSDVFGNESVDRDTLNKYYQLPLEDVKKATKIESVEIDSLVPTQRKLSAVIIDKYMKSKIDLSDVVIVRINGQNFIKDGHHRLAAALVNGKTHVQVQVARL